MPQPLLSVHHDGPVAHVRLDRPDVRNAFNAQLIADLRAAFERLGADPNVRAIILAGEGKTFCGGADIHWMRGSLALSHAENMADAQQMSDMFRAIDRCPKPVVGKIHGAALGGGSGLVSVCDIAIAANDTIFGFTETKLGILPAVISPFVLAKIGPSHARALFLTGERFNAQRAQAIGLVHEVVAPDELDAAVDRIIAELLTAGPTAVAEAKALIVNVQATDYDGSRDLTAQTIARQRTTPEGQEGLRAFLERRKPTWSAHD